ncbi:hypothetical protein Q9233_011997 [Columba guinea]|nr:hypothetical protein Q9233_011997 [Columba guinea]
MSYQKVMRIIVVYIPFQIKTQHVHSGDLLTFLDFSLQEAIEAQRHEFHLELQRKEEEIRQELAQRLKEKDTILKEAKQQLQTEFEHRMLMLKEARLKLEEMEKGLEDEIAMFIHKKANAELLQSQATFSTPTLSLKRDKDGKKNPGFRFGILYFDVRDEEIANVHELSEREREKLERERNSLREFQQ